MSNAVIESKSTTDTNKKLNGIVLGKFIEKEKKEFH